MSQTNFTLDQGTADAIELLKREFKVTSSTEVIRRAIALARIASRNTGDDKVVTMLDQNEKPIKVALQG